jgi:hypothetical protein
MQDLERQLEQAVFGHPQIKRLFAERYRRVLLAERRRKRTLLDWLYKKGRIDVYEHRAGLALAMLIEWRAAALSSPSSSTVFQAKAIQAPPGQLPVELPLLVRNSLDDAMGEGGTQIGVDEIRTKPGNAIDLFNETIRDRLAHTACATQEVRRLDNVLQRALPERPDLMTVLGHCVTERITRHEIPSNDVEVLCKALYVVKELWRYELLEDLIDEATGTASEAREEAELLRDILNPEAYRRALAEKLPRRGLEIVRQERRRDNPYKRSA